MECRRCDRRFASKQALSYHETHKVCLKFVRRDKSCQYCEREFASAQMAALHEARGVCKKVRVSLTCEKCNKTFTAKHNLDYHIAKAVCLKNVCKWCELDKSAYWHKERCLPGHYEVEDMECYVCGDLCSRCKHKEPIKDLIRIKMKWDRVFAKFDAEHPWENRSYWTATCKGCGCERQSGEHIMNCIDAEQECWDDYVERLEAEDKEWLRRFKEWHKHPPEVKCHCYD